MTFNEWIKYLVECPLFNNLNTNLLLWTSQCLKCGPISTFKSHLYWLNFPPKMHDSGILTCPNCSTIMAFVHNVSFRLLYLVKMCLFFKVYFKHALLCKTLSDHLLNVLFLPLQKLILFLLGHFLPTIYDLVT